MKLLKFLIIAIVAIFSFANVNAQTVVRERVVVRHHRGGYHWHHRWYAHRVYRHHHWRYY